MIRLEIKEEKKSDEYYYCKKCKKEFIFDNCKLDGAPISGTYFISPCCERDISWEDDIKKRERNIVIKRWVAVDDILNIDEKEYNLQTLKLLLKALCSQSKDEVKE